MSSIWSLCLIFVLVPQVSSSIIETGDDIQFSPLHRIEDDVYALGGKNISMDGFIDGDFTAFTYGATVNGEINGNANLFCRTLNHNGRIENNLHAFVESANINGITNRSVIAFCNNFNLSGNGLVERDLTVFCAMADIGGTVKGSAKICGNEIRIFGIVEGDLNVEGEIINISSSAVIKGNLTYKSPKEIEIDTASGAVILGTIERVETDEDKKGDSDEFRTIVVNTSKLLAAFLFGLLILIPFRRYAKEAVEQLSQRAVVSFAAGLITMFVFLFAVVVVVLSAITFLIGYALISGEAPAAGAVVLTASTIILPISAFGAVSGGILFYLGKIVLAFLVGYMIVRALKKEAVNLSKTQLLLGLVVLAVIFAMPYLGMLLYILGGLTGAGAIVLAIRKINFEISRAKTNEPPPAQ